MIYDSVDGKLKHTLWKVIKLAVLVSEIVE